jgi:hypothetical protein
MCSREGIWALDSLPAGASATSHITASIAHVSGTGAAARVSASGGCAADLLNDDRTPSRAHSDETLTGATATVTVRRGLPYPYLVIDVNPRHDVVALFGFTIEWRLLAAAGDRRRGWCTGTVRVFLAMRIELKDHVGINEVVGATPRLTLHGTTCRFTTQRVVVRKRVDRISPPSHWYKPVSQATEVRGRSSLPPKWWSWYPPSHDRTKAKLETRPRGSAHCGVVVRVCGGGVDVCTRVRLRRDRDRGRPRRRAGLLRGLEREAEVECCD